MLVLYSSTCSTDYDYGYQCDGLATFGWVGLGIGAATGIGSIVLLSGGIGMHRDEEASAPAAHRLHRAIADRRHVKARLTIGAAPQPHGARLCLGVAF